MLKKYIITPVFREDSDTRLEDHIAGHFTYNWMFVFFAGICSVLLYSFDVPFVSSPFNILFIMTGTIVFIGLMIVRSIVNSCVKFITDNTRQYWMLQKFTALNPDTFKNITKKQQSMLSISMVCYLFSLVTTFGVIVSFNPIVVVTTLTTVLTPIAIVVGILCTARAVFRLSVKLNNHITDRAAHNQSESTSD